MIKIGYVVTIANKLSQSLSVPVLTQEILMQGKAKMNSVSK